MTSNDNRQEHTGTKETEAYQDFVSSGSNTCEEGMQGRPRDSRTQPITARNMDMISKVDSSTADTSEAPPAEPSSNADVTNGQEDALHTPHLELHNDSKYIEMGKQLDHFHRCRNAYKNAEADVRTQANELEAIKGEIAVKEQEMRDLRNREVHAETACERMRKNKDRIKKETEQARVVLGLD